MKRMLSLLVLTTVIGVLTVRPVAGQHADANPDREYPVIAAAGEWMVLVAHYTGPEAHDLAKQMAYKIRAQRGWPAYTYEFVDPELKRQKEEFERRNAENRKRLAEEQGIPPENVVLKTKVLRLPVQYGVLIGGWATVKEAQAAAEAVRSKQSIDNTPIVVSAEGRLTMDAVTYIKRDDKGRPVVGSDGMPVYETKRDSPFRTAMVTRNPALPQQHAAKQAVDPGLKNFNSEEEYSLLKCPKKYTLLVKEYSGTMAYDGNQPAKDNPFLKILGLSNNTEGLALAASGAQAHETARFLRELRFEAYVLHGRTSSAITIGGFDSPDDPAIQSLTRKLAELHLGLLAKNNVDPIQLNPTPIPVEIPRP